MIAVVMFLAADLSASACDLSNISTARALHAALGHRAANIIAAASARGADTDALLDVLVDKSASFDLGAGDAGRPLGTGTAGARSLAETMNANQFRFLGWDYMDRSVDACAKQSVTVDFISNTDQRVSQVEFTFERGKLMTAKGWQRSFEAGALPSPTPVRKGANAVPFGDATRRAAAESWWTAFAPIADIPPVDADV